MNSSSPRRASTRTIRLSASATRARPGSQISRQLVDTGNFSKPAVIASTNEDNGEGWLSE